MSGPAQRMALSRSTAKAQAWGWHAALSRPPHVARTVDFPQALHHARLLLPVARKHGATAHVTHRVAAKLAPSTAACCCQCRWELYGLVFGVFWVTFLLITTLRHYLLLTSRYRAWRLTRFVLLALAIGSLVSSHQSAVGRCHGSRMLLGSSLGVRAYLRRLADVCAGIGRCFWAAGRLAVTNSISALMLDYTELQVASVLASNSTGSVGGANMLILYFANIETVAVGCQLLLYLLPTSRKANFLVDRMYRYAMYIMKIHQW